MIPRGLIFAIAVMWATVHISSGLTGFEKLTGLDFKGNTYYTIRNLSLWECQGWCREEPECVAASFSFVLNPIVPEQNTVCLLQNETVASNPAAAPQRAVSIYYMVKLHIPTDAVCNRPWHFERVPRTSLRGYSRADFFTSTKESCLAACLIQDQFVCRSVQYDYNNMSCSLMAHDRRSVSPDEFIVTDTTDYFENLCLEHEDACTQGHRIYAQPKQLGVPYNVVADYVYLYFYVDKQLMANSAPACSRACEIENEFLCRSFLYTGPPDMEYNCYLYHMDHFSLPDGASTFLTATRPLFDKNSGQPKYFENMCKEGDAIHHHHHHHGDGTGGIIGGTGGTGGSKPNNPNPGSSNENCDPTGTCYDVSVHCKDTRISVQVLASRNFNGRLYALGRSETCNINIINSSTFRLDLSMEGQDCNTQSANGVYTNTVIIQHHSVVMTRADKIYKVRCTYDMSSKNISFGMMPIRDPAMIPITSAPVAPAPRIRILDTYNKEVETVRIGDKLIFRIEIPEKTPYGIFARSCVAMAKDSRSTFQIIDDDGCPVEPTIFPRFAAVGSALQAVYEAFRFTESYGVIFQCNVKYCLGPCEPAICRNMMTGEDQQSYGRKKRSLKSSQSLLGSVQETTKEAALAAKERREEEMSISQEILVLDLGDEEQLPQFRKTENSQSVRENYYTNTTFSFDNPEVTLFETCPTRSSVLALAATCAVLLLIYVLTMFYFVMRKWVRPPIKNLR